MSTFKIMVYPCANEGADHGRETFLINFRNGLRKRKIPFEKVDIISYSDPDEVDLHMLLEPYFESDKEIYQRHTTFGHYLLLNFFKKRFEKSLKCSIITNCPRGKELNFDFLKKYNEFCKNNDIYQIKGRLSDLPEFKSVREEGRSIFETGESVGASEMNTVIEEIIARYLVPRGIV